MMEDKTYNLFVYGTLKENQSNHHYLSKSPVMKTRIAGFTLYTVDGMGYPVALPSDKSSDYILGEVYKISAEQLEAIDRLEVKDVLYSREEYRMQQQGFWTKGYVYIGIPEYWENYKNLKHIGAEWS